MVRNYKRKTDRACYSREKLLQAITAVRNGELSAYRASIVYGIPRPTIVSRLYDRRGLKSNTLGRSTVLSKEVEEYLARNLHAMERYGFGLTRKEILEIVGEYVTTNNIPNSFKNGIPGEHWFLRFKQEHKLSVKKPQAVENSRKKACNPFVIYPYFDLLKETLDELDLHGKPSHIWNLDETSFSKDPKKTKVVGLKGYASTRTISSPGKDNTTVLLGCNAVGEKTPPLIIYKGKNVWDEWTSKEDYPGTVYAATQNGWMETKVFETFFEKVFLKTIGNKRPILLIYDGHSTHVGINIIEKAREAKVTILKIPPHTSDNLQPLDLAVNKSFKDKWDLALVKWQRLHVGQILPKKEFSKIIGEVWTQIDPSVCAAGFRKAGAVPYNKNVIPEEKFHSDKLKEWKDYLKSTIAQQVLNESEPSIFPTETKKPFPPYHSASHLTFFQDESPVLKSFQSQNENNIIIGISKQASYIFHPPALMNICLNILNCHLKYNVPRTDTTVETNKSIHISDERINYDFLLPTVSTPETYQENENKPEDIIGDINNLSMVPLNYDIVSKSKQNTKKLSNRILPQINILNDQCLNLNVTFDELLLRKIKSGTTTKQKRTKIAEGAEVITNEDVYKRRKLIEEENTKKLITKEEKKARKLKKNVKKTTKKIKKVTYRRKIDESSSESEMNIHFDDETDSDLDYDIYCANIIAADEEECDKENDSDNYNEPTTSTGKTNKIKRNTTKTKDLTTHYGRKNKYEGQNNTELHVDEIIFGANEEENTNIHDQPGTSTIKQGQWALVQFATKKTVKHYIGQVTDLDYDGKPTINFVRKSRFSSEDKTAFTFPSVPDICRVKHLEDILVKLPRPTIGRRGQVTFKMSFAGYNIQ